MRFDPKRYGREVETILAFDGNGERLLPLVAGECSSPAAYEALKKQNARELFSGAAAPEAAMAGLWVYFSGFEEAHRIAQDIDSPEGSLWHGIVHRQEPDANNAAYWFRHAGSHPIFPALAQEALEIVKQHPDAGFRVTAVWDPFEFIAFCDRARQQPLSESATTAVQIQRSEWQLLFDHCARPRQ
jgi:hypothetical protein